MEGTSALRIFLAVVCGVALIGFVRGTTTPEDTPVAGEVSAGEVSHTAEGVSPARSYAELRDSPRGAGSGWEEDLDALGAPDPDGASDPSDLPGRASRRAYDGAPPRIPHAVRQDAAAECLACHEEGLRFRGLVATPMSHTRYTNCTQCHVVEAAPMPGGEDLPPDPRAVPNTFAGRAWQGATPP